MQLNEKIFKYIITKSNKIKINSNDIKKNDIFIALKGEKLPPDPNIPELPFCLNISIPLGLIIDSGLPKAILRKPSPEKIPANLDGARNFSGLIKPLNAPDKPEPPAKLPSPPVKA